MSMDCPQCNESGAYHGLMWIHCMNEKCRFFDAYYTSRIRAERHKKAVDTLQNFIILPDEDGI